MDDGVARGEQVAAGGVEAESVAAHVAGDCGDAAGRHLGEALLAQLGAQAVEGVVLEDLAGQALLDGGAAAGAHEQHELAVGDASEQTFEEVGAEEAGGAGDEEASAGEGVSDHG